MGPGVNIAGRRKAAILLVSLGAEGAAEVVKHLPDDLVEKLTIELARTNDVPPDHAEAVQKEVVDTAYARGWIASGGAGFARTVLERALGDHRATEIFGRLRQVIEHKPFEFLRGTPPDQIYAFLRGEHPQTVALVVANLPSTDLAARVIALMAPDDQVDVALRVASMTETSPEVVKEIAAVMRDKLQTVLEREYATAGGPQALAEILNSAGRATEKNILEHLEQANADLANEIRSLLFTFDDLISLDDRSIQLVLKNVDSKELALALRGANDEVRDWLLANMSERASEALKEELEYMPPQRRRVVEEAQLKVVAAARKLEEEGEITISRGGDDEDELVA